MILIICCICGQKCSYLETFEGAPHNLMSVYNTNYLELRDLDIYHCYSCGHTQIPTYLSEEYYQDYSMGSYWGSSFKRVRQQQISRLVSLLSKRERFLDIGCGVGHYLELAQEHFNELYGVEPSARSAIIAAQKGFNIIQDYFHEGLKFDAGFDAISMIEVLEHLEQPSALFELAAQSLNEDGILIVEVPNGQRIMSERLYYNLCTDHIQYFSVSSLATMAQRAGLSIICVQASPDPNLLELYARKRSRPSVTFGNKRESTRDYLVSRIPNGSRVAAWGAGAESSSFLAMLEGILIIDCIFDSNNEKDGQHIAGIPIVIPTREAVSQYDIVILFANSHKEQITSQLYALNFQGQLLAVGN
ncbi:class I SAM-dependent methyltransferase [Paenibacillus sp. PL2-23]|uniref:class I SAM-dependent methyltransferase n=1 Tax=Paenibacillus sp. PL2-23 TaxID=2100729 RepID=UPI0030F9990D